MVFTSLCALTLPGCTDRAQPVDSAPSVADAEGAFALPEFETTAMEPGVARLLDARRAAVLAAPRDARRWAELGFALDAHQLLREAEVALSRAVALDPRGFEHVYQHAFVGALTGAPQAEVLARYDAALALRPDYAAAHLRRGELLLEMGRAADALAAFERAVALDAGYDRAKIASARALLALERARDAVAVLTPLAAQYPSDRDVISTLVQALRAAGDEGRAEPYLATLTELPPGALPFRDPVRAATLELTATASARYQRARQRMERGDARGAVRELEQLVTERPQEATVALELARIHVRQRSIPAASDVLERALAAQPQHPALLAFAGQLDVERGRFAAGLQRLDEAARRGPLDLASLHARASALGQVGRWSEAAGAFLEAAALAPAPAEFRILAGLSLCEAGRFEEARAEHAAGLALDAQHPLAATLGARLEGR
ncbi:MAG: tetratricopeptide repeat protein [Planctomycetota bacterium]